MPAQFLTIRDAQLHALGEIADARFRERIVVALMKQIPEHAERLRSDYRPMQPLRDAEGGDGTSANLFERFIDDAFAMADMAEITADGDRAAFIGLMAVFDAYEAGNASLFRYVQDVLHRERDSGALRMAMIESRLTALGRRGDASTILHLVQAMRKAVA